MGMDMRALYGSDNGASLDNEGLSRMPLDYATEKWPRGYRTVLTPEGPLRKIRIRSTQ
jgi:hypothetical protein